MSSSSQLGTDNLDDQTSQPVGEGFLTLITSAGNYLYFRSPAEREVYRNANLAQLGRNRGEGDDRRV